MTATTTMSDDHHKQDGELSSSINHSPLSAASHAVAGSAASISYKAELEPTTEPDPGSQPPMNTHIMDEYSMVAGMAHKEDHGEGSISGTQWLVQPTIRKHGLAKALVISKTIHILGTGTVGKFIAHSLARMPEAPPVTLLVHRRQIMEQWSQEGRAINLIKDGQIISKSELKVEAMFRAHSEDPVIGVDGRRSHTIEPSNDIIETLIVTTDGPFTVPALSAIKHRLRSYSTVCFIQDGLGIVDEVNNTVFPRISSRPSYMLGNISHDLQPIGNMFSVLERRPGTLHLTMIPQTESHYVFRKMNFGWTIRSRNLMRTLCRASELQATGLLVHDFYKLQLEKLAINSVIGPLSVVYQCTNDHLLYNFQITQTMRLLLKEISAVLCQMTEVSRVPNIEQYFSPERLEVLVVNVIGKMGKNRTAMLQAVMDGSRTNIDFETGYLLSRAADLGINCPCLEMMVSMVKGKQAMISRDRNSHIQFIDEYQEQG